MSLTGLAYMYSRDDCKWCDKASVLLKNYGYEVIKKDIKWKDHFTEWKRLNVKTVPQIVIDGKLIGGYQDLEKYLGHV